MAGSEKSEKATQKKRRDERKKGNVFLSKDAIAVVTLFGSFAMLKLMAGSMVDAIHAFFRLCFQFMQTTPTGGVATNISTLLVSGARTLAIVIGPMLAVTCVLSVAATFFQTRMLVSGESIKPKFNRISPMQGFKRLFSLRSVVEALKGIIKITILLYIIYNALTGAMTQFFNYLRVDLTIATSDLLETTFSMVVSIGIAFVVLAGFDFLYQWWDYERGLKMTKQEVKDEYKQIEGDPQVKGKIKEKQRQMAQSRMMQGVPNADVVIRNPTHVAVALRYKPEIDNAPIVIAMGLDSLALRIVSVAEEHEVTVIENVPLARALYAQSELNREIPPDLYGAVADVLVYIFRVDETGIHKP